jgi:iron transport multicopper oxidase
MMARGTMRTYATALVALLLPVSSLAANTTTYDLDISWMKASPDGFERTVIGVNGKWPPPTLYANKGDQLIINVVNSLGNESTSLHFHGMFQNKTTHMDGAVGATQCAIPPGAKFTYNFTASISPESQVSYH